MNPWGSPGSPMGSYSDPPGTSRDSRGPSRDLQGTSREPPGGLQGFSRDLQGPDRDPPGPPGTSSDLSGISWGPLDISGATQGPSEDPPGTSRDLSESFRVRGNFVMQEPSRTLQDSPGISRGSLRDLQGPFRDLQGIPLWTLQGPAGISQDPCDSWENKQCG